MATNINSADFIKFITVKKGLRAGSIRTYTTRLNVINKWLKEADRRLDKDSVEDFLLYLRKLGRNNNTLNTYVFTFRYIKDYLQDRGLPNDFDVQSFEKYHPPIIPLTDEEIDRLLEVNLVFKIGGGTKVVEAQTIVVNALARFLADTGCRWNEAASLKVKYVDLSAEKAMIAKTKNGDFRFVYFTPILTIQLKKIIEGKNLEDLVFTSIKGNKLHPGDFNQRLRKMAEIAGINKHVHAHLLRHSYATSQYQETKDIAMVATLGGWRDIQTPYETYVHLADKVIKQSARRNPRWQKYITPLEALKNLQASLEPFNIEEDNRFSDTFKRGLHDLFFDEASRLKGKNF